MNYVNELIWALPFLMYAETHYRFKYLPSYLRKPEPELIADAPHRIDPGSDIPLLILAKDADKFPAKIVALQVRFLQNGVVTRDVHLIEKHILLKDTFWWKIFTLERGQLRGWLELDVIMTLETRSGTRTYRADNHRTSSHLPLSIYLSNNRLPAFSGLQFGDAHTHSQYTDDQVEFGVPVDASVELSKSMGLSFICVADHSYDLDDSVNDYSSNDPALPKWKSLTREVRNKNSNERNFVVLQGEEVSCRNANGKNVHLLLLGDSQFFHGSGDSAERWFRTRSEYSIDDILSLKQGSALAFAAHPREPVSRLQRVLLGRDSWSANDLSDHRLSGTQFANGMNGIGFTEGYRIWIRCLLKGQRVFCLAGNDSHGNFNRFRQIGIPFFTIRERNIQLFGKMKTALFVDGDFDQSTVLDALARGRYTITDGPVANIVSGQSDDVVTSLGDNFRSSDFDFSVLARSTSEFGPIAEVKIFVGTIGSEGEELFIEERVSQVFEYRRAITVPVSKRMYVRVEAYTSATNESDGKKHFCFTNPLWIDPA